MSQASENSNGNKSAVRFTATATINCAAYPADSVSRGDRNRSPPLSTENNSVATGISKNVSRVAGDGNWNNSSIGSTQNSSSSCGGYRFGPKKFTSGGDSMSSTDISGNCGSRSIGVSNGAARVPPAPPAPPLPNIRSFNGNANQTSTLTKAKASMPSASAYNSLPRGFVANNRTNNPTWSSAMSKPNISSTSGNVKVVAKRSDSADVRGKPKVDVNDPQVRKLVYNMYRGMLDKQHEHSNNIINSLPDIQVDRDEGVKDRLLSMMKQQEEMKSGRANTMNGPAGPPPPPPPPPFIVPGAAPPVMPEPAAPSKERSSVKPLPEQSPMIAPPAALAGAMMKDKKPFTYTPGGLDLSEISPGPDGTAAAHEAPPMQSRSFRILQNVVDSEASEPQGPVHLPKIKGQQQQQQRMQGSSSGAIPSRAFRALQQHTLSQHDVAVPGESDL